MTTKQDKTVFLQDHDATHITTTELHKCRRDRTTQSAKSETVYGDTTEKERGRKYKKERERGKVRQRERITEKKRTE